VLVRPARLFDVEFDHVAIRDEVEGLEVDIVFDL
jgi:hypothetical protein